MRVEKVIDDGSEEYVVCRKGATRGGGKFGFEEFVIWISEAQAQLIAMERREKREKWVEASGKREKCGNEGGRQQAQRYDTGLTAQ